MVARRISMGALFKQPASSLRVESGTWLVCSEMGYQGECRVLGPGEYPQLVNVVNGGVYFGPPGVAPRIRRSRYTVR
jgi:hypothetical protein